MEVIFSVIFPIFGIMALGAIAEKYRLLGPGVAVAINQYVYYFALPALLFTATASVKIDSILNWNFIIAFSLATLLTSILCFFVAKFILHEELAITTLQALSASFSNVGYMGIPILALLLGPKTVIPATVATLLQFFLFVISIIIINVSLEKDVTGKNLAKLIFHSFVKNPIAIAGIFGILWSLSGWKLPKPIYTLGHELGLTAGTCALFAIGKIMMSLKPAIKIKEQSVVCFFKLIAQPLIILPFFFLFNVDDFWAASGFILAALPPATLVYIIAQNYNLHEKSIAGILLVSNLLSIITLAIAMEHLPDIWPNLNMHPPG